MDHASHSLTVVVSSDVSSELKKFQKTIISQSADPNARVHFSSSAAFIAYYGVTDLLKVRLFQQHFVEALPSYKANSQSFLIAETFGWRLLLDMNAAGKTITVLFLDRITAANRTVSDSFRAFAKVKDPPADNTL